MRQANPGYLVAAPDGSNRFVAVAGLASWIPASRASRLDPNVMRSYGDPRVQKPFTPTRLAQPVRALLDTPLASAPHPTRYTPLARMPIV
jgi:hypothetical protein